MALDPAARIAAVAIAAGGAAMVARFVWDTPLVAGAAAALAAALAAHFLDRATPGVAPPGPAAAPPDRGALKLPDGTGRQVLAELPAAVLLIDALGSVTFMNAAAEALLGRRPPGEFPAQALRVPRLLEAIEAARTGAEPVSVDFTVARGAESHLRAQVRRLVDREHAPAAGVVVLIEDRTAALKARDLHRDFVANASHELKTPLASVSGLIETLQGHARDDPEAQARFLGLMGQQVARMTRLVEDLLSLNRIELNARVRPDTPQPLGRIASEVADSLAPAAERAGMRIELGDLAAVPEVAGSREELAQALGNLIDNAIRYGRQDTAVTVEERTDPEGRPGMVGIAVADRGPGIAREHIPRLTERFYRVSAARSREKGGTGLGLAIVKHIANRHRGGLEIESEPGKGSRFTLWLPAIPPVPGR